MSAIRAISSTMAEIARVQINEDTNQVDSHLSVIRSWLVECNLQCGPIDDQFLMAFLRGCKFSLEKAKKKIVLFHNIRSELPQIVQNRDPVNLEVLRVIRMGVAVPLPKTEKMSDPKIFLIRVGQFNVSQCTFADVMKVGTMINDILMRDDDQMVICGMTLIIDLQGVTRNHLMHFEMNFLKKVAILSQDASPLRMQGIHILNPPPGLQTAMSIFNSLLSEKNQSKRIFVHGRDLPSLYKHFPPTLLPKEYGGTLGSVDDFVHEWEMKMVENRTYLLEMASISATQKSPIIVENAGIKNVSAFGFEGSFRKLNFD
ncbi:alpha-tocopherol transfer protein-like [Anopheles aquasalis]|uniref:alpha-tocopherol transfer protein-like n=1 Tax=Anopheles aquasalis TaxID=42839 RepID=UPI00215B393A|nr:alpha-tocopherol transfer protein-like [Anopheles aquasalis]